ncbi:seryl-tRNA synthetase family protein [Trichomonas vaginalis G3]|uniref:serine--tRNA ligase n=1 Tax=Trichomonas vaginalis (strain ATCC PRA-98 / G3) TaxID=412133 RepID=A2ERB4_TRIV3|nr:Ser-tRNA ligase family [Trichomonas vaginalis G3]EAY04790.1 seryl-tRNA synthetase family protein [Trichomonas vaginalis G3]KAI5490991.1 Ser-tRNA ligase family [Trichomonas vaginalis G3]|eukprot:XP_001317013.1 seryl-tRNA synthetase family protein [Trichomonas vaginalis G3]
MSAAKKSSTAQVFTAGVDIKNFRGKTDAELQVWRDNQKKRNRPPELIDQIVKDDEEYRAALKAVADTMKEKNQAQASLKPKGGVKLSPEEMEAVKEKCRQLAQKITELEAKRDELFAKVEKELSTVGVMIEPEVPVSLDEANNKVIMQCGKIPEIPNFKPHNELLAMIDGYEPERGARVAGHRGYYLKGMALKLNQALFRYGLDFLQAHGYTAIHTPFFMKSEVMARVCQLEDFQETLYHIDSPTNDPKDDMFLIATSEQTLCGYHLNESLDDSQLPKKYCGFSSCFRKEAGASGKDNWGIFRVHQFEKVEQFCITSPHNGESQKMHEQMVHNSCEFIKSLGLPFRAVLVVSGELNYSTARKVDIEAWFPSYNQYRELVSASNCKDFQSRKLDIRYGHGKNKDGEKEYVHMLNATLCATERTLCCILENYQTPTGIRIPKVLQPYMRELMINENHSDEDYNKPDLDLQSEHCAVPDFKNIDFIPFVQDAKAVQGVDGNTSV